MKDIYYEKPEFVSVYPAKIIEDKFTDESGFILSYRLLLPELEEGRKYPLIIHLHGAGSWAEDYQELPGQCLCMLKKNYPAIVLVPKTNHPMKWADHDWTLTEHHQKERPLPSLRATYELVQHLLKTDPGLDAKQVYIIGQSMGGFGTWDFITRYRHIIAAAVPVCGGGDVETMKQIADLPVWIFHGGADDVVPVENSRKLFAELKRLGAPARYTEYNQVLHASWTPAYNDENLFRWLFDQKLK